MEPAFYREMNAGEEQAVCDLVRQVFNEYVASDYGRDGVEEFFRFANPDAMKKRVQSDGFVLVAHQVDRLVGMLEIFPAGCIAMLFVTVQQQGIGKTLLTRAISKAQALNPGLPTLSVHSSPYAESIYQKMGFRKTGNTRTENGITYIPMALLLKNAST